MTLHSALLHLSKKCNLDCPHCYYSAGERTGGGGLTYQQWTNAMKKLKENEFREIVFVGGEPTLLPYFYELLQNAVYNFERVSIQTNATLPRADIISLAVRIKKKGSIVKEGVRRAFADVGFVISIEDAREDYNQKIRGKFQLDHAIYFIKLLKSKGIENISIRTTIFQDNDVDKMIRLSEELGVNLTFMRFYTIGRGKHLNLGPDKDRIYKVYKRVLDYNKTHSKNILINSPIFYMADQRLFKQYKGLFGIQPIACASAEHRVSITQNGDVYPCQMLHQTVKLGNVLENGMDEIKEKARKFREDLLEKDPISKCKGCPFLEYCNGGCMYYTYHRDKRGDPLCPIPKLLDEAVIELI